MQNTSQGLDMEVPWGPLYGMSKEELLVLRKALTELLAKRWIRASSSSGGAPVLFIKKPGEGTEILRRLPRVECSYGTG